MGMFTALRQEVYPDKPFDGFPAAADFSLQVAGALAGAAQLSYEVLVEDKFATILGQWRWQCLRVLNASADDPQRRIRTKGFAASCGGETLIAFAGTEPEQPGDWLEDFSVLRDATGAHDGFKAGVDAVWDDIRSIATAMPGRLYLAGHSLGGALAGIAAHRLIAEAVVAPDRIRGVYTIGMPRIGDAAYAAAYNAAGNGMLGDRTFRLIHGEDIVTKVPPTELGYRHVGRPLSCPRGGQFGTAVPAVAEEAPVADGTLRAAWSLLDLPLFSNDDGLPSYPSPNHAIAMAVAMLPKPIRDHLADRYLAALGVLAKP